MPTRLPPKLYKYRKIDDHTQSVFTRHELYFAAPQEFNDPFDCGFHVNCKGKRSQDIYAATALQRVLDERPSLSPEEACEVAERIGATIGTDHSAEVTTIFNTKLAFDTNDRVGILSLAERNDEILMWSHYADCHRGVCIEFRADSLIFARAQRVAYNDEYPNLDLREVVENEGLREAARWMLTKSSRWSYEREWRVLDFQAGPGVQTFPATCISGVVLGCRISDEDREKVREWTKCFPHSVVIVQARRSTTQFRLEMETVEWAKRRRWAPDGA